MPSPLRRPSRSVRVLGKVTGPVRLGNQSTGRLLVPALGRSRVDDETPQSPQGPVPPPRKPNDAGAADPGVDDAAQAEASPAEASPPDPGAAETKASKVTPAGARDADTSPADSGPADTSPADTSAADTSPAETSPAETSPADTSAADSNPADADSPEDGSAEGGPGQAGTGEVGREPGPEPQTRPRALPRRTPGASHAGPASPPRAPARQRRRPRPAPSTAAPAVRPGGAPAARPGSAPATRPGAVPATRPAAGVPARRPTAEPSWGIVLVTTFRLWAKRRLEQPWLRALLVVVLAAIVFCAGALTTMLTRGNPASRATSNTTSETSRGSATGQGTIPGGSGALAAVASARRQAATWVARQVNPDEVIGCDPMMCAALAAADIQANRLLVLSPSLPDPLGSEILLDTATLRSQFGGRLETVYAPVSLAAFGSGVARVEVRFVVPDGARTYLAELARDVAARKAASAEMLRNHSIHASPAARRQLAAGQVDSRLLVMLVALAHNHPVDVIGFAANQDGASPGVPIRSAEIAGAPGPGSTPAVSVPTLRRFLLAQQPPYRPSIIAVTTASRRTVLRVGYPAPSLLGLLGTHG